MRLSTFTGGIGPDPFTTPRFQAVGRPKLVGVWVELTKNQVPGASGESLAKLRNTRAASGDTMVFSASGQTLHAPGSANPLCPQLASR